MRASGEHAPRVIPGQVQAARRVPLAFRVGGPVVELAVSKGQRVRQGELLARIDPRDYEVQVKDLEARLSEKRAQLDQVAEEYQRVRGLFQNNLLDAQNAALTAEFAAETAVYDFLKDWAEVQRSVADLGPDR